MLSTLCYIIFRLGLQLPRYYRDLPLLPVIYRVEHGERKYFWAVIFFGNFENYRLGSLLHLDTTIESSILPLKKLCR